MGDRGTSSRDQPPAPDFPGRAHTSRTLPLGLRRGHVRLRQPSHSTTDEHPRAPQRLHRLEGAQTDIDRITTIWRDCLTRYGGPYLFGSTPTAADAIYAPICSRFETYDISLDADCARYRDTMLGHPAMIDWIAQAHAESEQVEELDAEF
jgi:glutathione S-transferase